MELLRSFEKISKHDASIAGGKGASLGEMTQAGIPVPPGYVVLASTFDCFIEETKLKAEIDSILHRVKKEEMESVERASEEIQALILSAKMPKDIANEIKKYFKELNAEFVAVRSSATAEDSSAAAWAGQLDTFLNTTEKTLLQNVQKCWASLFTPRAIFYRFEKGLHNTHISVAVVVQKMVQSEISGIAFSVHPVTQDYNQMIIEAGFGLGEAIVSGQITPDSYVLEKKPLAIIEKNVSTQSKGIFRQKGGGNEWKDIPSAEGEKQKLSEKQIMELGKLILRIEDHYDFPVDVEWAYEKGKFYITQSRPITTLTANASSPEKKKKVISKKPEVVKPAANENPIINGREWRLTVTRNMSFWHQWNSSIAHYHHSFDYGVKGRFHILTFTMNGTQTSCFADPLRFPAYSNAVMEAVSTPAKVDALHEKYVLFAGKLEKALAACLAKPTLTNWQQFGQEYIRNTAGLMITAQVGREGVARLEKRLKELGYPAEKIPETIGIITYPSHHTPLFQSQYDLLEIGRKIQSKKIKGNEIQKELEKWLEQHGYIPVNFCEDPWTLENAKEQLAQLMKKDCAKEMEAYASGHQKRVQHARELLKKINDGEVDRLAYALQVSTYLNEFRKNLFCRVSLRVRPIFALIAKKAKLKNWRDCYYFTNEELGQMLEGKLPNPQKLIQQRQTVAYEVDDDGKAIILSPSDAGKLYAYVKSHYGQTPQSASGVDTIMGFSANKGKVTGIAKVILSSKDFHKLQAKEILVTTMTSVDFVPLMEKAAAFVTNEGGITSHAAIVSREMNKPCIIGTKNATQIIKDGDLIEVDADKGIVKILSKNNSISIAPRVFSRDFSVAAIQIATRGESMLEKPWTKGKRGYSPHIIGERTDGTIHWYYHPAAWEWMKQQLIARCKEDKKFISKVEQHVRKGIVSFRSIYEKEEALPIKELKSFMNDFINAYPWIESMWLLYRMEPKELGVDNAAMKELRVQTDRLSAGTDVVIRKSLLKAYPKLGKWAAFMTLDEVLQGKIPSIKTLQERDRGFIQVDNQLHVGMTHEQLRDQYGIEFETIVAEKDQKIIQGEPAQKGKVRGKVCRVMGHNDFGKIKQGEILISPMTMPDFLPEMKKAAAIVTDEGGMMCHAAIVAREMKIPCIVGTKVATVVLKDGDEVEVDATKGIIRKLKP